jgi:hypothetical protein
MRTFVIEISFLIMEIRVEGGVSRLSSVRCSGSRLDFAPALGTNLVFTLTLIQP